MPRRISILLIFAIASTILAGSLLFTVPSSRYSTPLYHSTPAQPHAPQHTQVDVVYASSHQKPATNVPEHSGEAAAEAPDYPKTGNDRPLHITITETGGSHDEVVAALVHSFGSQRNAVIDLYQLLPRYGISDVMQSFTLQNPLPDPKHPDEFMRDSSSSSSKAGDDSHSPPVPELFVAGTCELDIIRFKTELATLLAGGKTYMFCVVHHADRWIQEELEEAIRPWVEAGKVEFWALSPHTARFLKTQSIDKWNVTKSGTKSLVRYFVPVFPVTLPSAHEGNEDDEELAFGLQGDYDPSRRDYANLFSRLSTFLSTGEKEKEEEKEEEGDETSKSKKEKDGKEKKKTNISTAPSKNITMHLLGHGNHPDVPKDVRKNVVFDERFDYIDFYSILSQTFALLPAFATTEYLDRKASSSVPAALIAGTPLVATQAMLDAYSYISAEHVWLQDEKKTDLDVVADILEMEPRVRRKKKDMVRKRCGEIVDGNIGRVGDWIKEAVGRDVGVHQS